MTLPPNTVNQLCLNTVTFKTQATDDLDQWRTQAKKIRDDWVGRGDDWTQEVAFMDALLAILDDTEPTIPDDNPYAEAVQAVQELIAEYDETE